MNGPDGFDIFSGTPNNLPFPRCCSLVICRIRPVNARGSNQRLPIAFASPVMESGPAPGLQKFPVAGRGMQGIVFETACVE